MERNVIRDKSQDFDSLFYVRALPNEYLVEIGRKKARPVLGGKRFRLFRRFLKIPASVQVIRFSVNNHSKNYQGIQVEGYACWRIDPGRVEHAVTTLDFYNAFNPMQKTSEDLRAICTEAIRHIVANLDIEEALKNKNEIARQLKAHLSDIEQRWGILFDQVGIEHIQILSDKVFADLQAKERDKLRLDAALSRFEADRKIGDAGTLFKREEREKQVELERRNLELAHGLEMEKMIARLEEIEKQKEVELGLLEKEKASLQRSLQAERQKLALERERREVENMVSRELVLLKLIEALPGCAEALHVDRLDVNLGPGRVEQALARAAELLGLADAAQASPEAK